MQSQSANDNTGGFHYDQEPRGQSFLSQISKQDLSERRQMKRPRPRRPQRRPAPNSRGAFTRAREYYEDNNADPDEGGGFEALRRPQRRPAPNSRGASTEYYEKDNVNADEGGGFEARRRPQRRSAPKSTKSRGAFTQEYYENDNPDSDEEDSFDEFKDNVSANLYAMTDLLKGMQKSQSVQTTDVQFLTIKVADMAERLTMTEAKNQMINQNSPGGMENRNFGTDLDGKFNQKIKDVIDEFDRANAANNNSNGLGQQGEDYYRIKIEQLEAKINEIDEALQVTEDKFNTQMEYVDLLVNQRLDDIDDASFDSMQFQQPPPPEPFFEERPPPPPLEELPPPPPPPLPPQESYDNPFDIDDGTRYYQERNYNQPNVPPRVQEISSNQKQQSDKSVNESSGGHHYKENNRSFISAFSKADNDNRRQFQPFRDPRRNQITQGEQLSRGPPPPRGSFAVPPREPMLPEYFEEPYFYEDGPLMEEDYFYDDMYEF
eukprot:CAMPEP_0201880462 /NCGR_PEP_ID=MMETSP0902-20130614/11034_1 /ASSEMBLY_ACC=CAM_ASM_000551 /TAXON_ID=420261 /ORGANISM="Thalassiosira antarctica, Strain CCMP982" /LENGTH=489 /DNA_ID=CAMNT_0048408469 /DNA_START=201 /DNA_END=1670 /DNA_ORIENTATION=+